MGVFTWQGDRFLNERGEELNITLAEVPLNGSLTVLIKILPTWIPAEQRYAQISVAQLNGSYQQIFDGVTEAQALIVNNLPSDEYIVTLSRAGFESNTWVAQLNANSP